MPSDTAYQQPRPWGPHETGVSQRHGCLHSHSTREHELWKETQEILKSVALLKINTEKLIRYVQSCSLNQNSIKKVKPSVSVVRSEMGQRCGRNIYELINNLVL